MNRAQGNIKIFILLVLTTLILYLPIFINPSILLNRGNDLQEFYWPILYFIKQSILTYKEIPLWNNLYLSGNPLISDPEAGIFYLPNIIFLIFPIDIAFMISILLHAIFSGITMFILAKKGFNLTTLASIFTAAAYIMWPRVAGYIEAGHFGFVTLSAWLPLTILSTLRLSKFPSLKWVVIFSISLTSIFFNNPFIFVVTLIALLLLFFCNFTISTVFFKRQVLFMCLGLIFTFGLSAITLLPQLEWIPQTTRFLLLKYPDVYPKWNSISEFALAIIFPWKLQINQIDSEKWLPMGLAMILLAGLGFMYLKMKFKILLLLATTPILIVSLNNASPFYPLLLSQDWYVLLRVSTRVFFVVQIIIIILAGYAINLLYIKALIPKFILSLIIFMTMIELLTLDWARLTIPIRPKDEVPQEVYQYLKQDKSLYRVFCLTRCIPQKEAAIHGLQLVEGYATPQLKNYYDQFIQFSQVFWDRYTLVLPPFEIYKFREIQPIASELAGYNIKYVISPYPIKDKDFIFEERFGNYLVYRNPLDKSRAYFSNTNQASIIEYSPNYIKIDASKAEANQLIVAEVYSPGWVASLDGKEEVEIKQIHNKLRQVEIKKGTKFIEMYYNPESFQLGKIINLFTLFILLFWGYFSVRKKGLHYPRK